MIKSFFMAAMTANFQGRALISFNVVTAIPQRNVTAAALQHIQHAGAEMMKPLDIEFDDLVIQNLFHLGDMTEAEFVAGVKPTTAEPDIADDTDQTEAGEVFKPRMELAVDNTAQNEHVEEIGTEAVIETPIDQHDQHYEDNR